MAKKNESHVVQTYRTVARSHLGLIVPPLILIPAVIWGLLYVNRRLVEAESDPLHYLFYVVPVAFLLLFPLWAKFRSWAFSRYRVTLDSVVEEHGLFSKKTSEIRIQDIRNIVVEQAFLDRMLMFGTVSFSSAAGTEVEVHFRDVARPNRIKELVRDIQARVSDGELTAADREAIEERALGPRAVARAREEEQRRAEKAAEKAAAKAKKAEEKAAAKRAAQETEAAEAEDAEDEAAEATEESAASSATTPVGDGSASSPAAKSSASASTEPAEEASGDVAHDELYRLLAEQAAEGKSES